VPLPEAVQKIKANSSRWVRERTGKFEWQEGYGVFSVSASNREAVIRYIDEQKQHHAKLTYEDEFVALLRSMRWSSIRGLFSDDMPCLRHSFIVGAFPAIPPSSACGELGFMVG
jgi:hypothetical protein